MSRKRYTAEQIISMLREAEVWLSQGQSVGHVCIDGSHFISAGSKPNMCPLRTDVRFRGVYVCSYPSTGSR